MSIVNPLIVKRYADMKMMRAKTDKVDSKRNRFRIKKFQKIGRKKGFFEYD